MAQNTATQASSSFWQTFGIGGMVKGLLLAKFGEFGALQLVEVVLNKAVTLFLLNTSKGENQVICLSSGCITT